MPKVICKHSRCNNLLEKGTNNGYCEDHKEYGEKLQAEAERYRQRSYNNTRKDTEETKFYNSRSWKKVRLSALKRDNYLCQDCLSKGIINSSWLEVHHITPLKHDYEKRLELENLKTLCRSCHKKADDLIRKCEMK
ncbi:HNH endonuclease [Terrisporobacter sp.]|uniref:HNH endonuclease n=1 Tax=Terrisporobacter sp. TaxID=1965305 RepID=UPI002898C218|nr:HNH endonuclease [Terrisporobacter sp.]